MHQAADRIRNVALVGHRGSGKTSLHEALLFQAGAVNRLGSVLDGTTVSDADTDEKSRQMSIAAALTSFQWDDRKVNLIDTPGDSSFIADALGALRVCESAVFVINAVMGAEVSTRRLWKVAAELGLPRSEPGDLRGGDAAHNAAVVRAVLAGEVGPVRDIVLLNAAAALAAAEGVRSPEDLAPALSAGLARAAEAIDSGAAAALLARWIKASQRLAATASS